MAKKKDLPVAEEKTGSKSKYKYVRRTFMYNGQRYEVRGADADEACRAMDELKKKLEKGIPVKQRNDKDSKVITAKTQVNEWATKWLENDILNKVRPDPSAPKKKGTMSEKSSDMYSEKLNKYILPRIGKMRLGEVQREHLQKILNDMAKDGLSESTIKKTRIVMNAMFAQACRDHIIYWNNADGLSIPATTEEPSERRSLTKYERDVILQVAKEHRCGLWIKFLLNTGLRPAESAPLQVRDIDFNNELVHVYKAIQSGTEKIVGDPKSKAGVRDVPIPEDILSELQEALSGKAPTDFVFPQMDGKTMKTTTSMSNDWRSFSRQVDLAMGAETTAHGHIYDPSDIKEDGTPIYPDEYGNPRNGHRIASDLVLYDLRHTYATDLQKRGISIQTAKVLLGHNDISVTSNIYTHSSEEDAIAAGKLINKAIKKEKKGAVGKSVGKVVSL